VYDVAVGDVLLLAVSGTASSTGLGCSLTSPDATDSAALAPGAAVYYMVRGRNACGIGSFGQGTSGADRASGACP
jgi:hypothetical protein